MGQMALFPPKEAVLWIFISLKNPSSTAKFEPMKLETNGKHYHPPVTFSLKFHDEKLII
jgi:hypothetical protein